MICCFLREVRAWLKNPGWGSNLENTQTKYCPEFSNVAYWKCHLQLQVSIECLGLDHYLVLL